MVDGVVEDEAEEADDEEEEEGEAVREEGTEVNMGENLSVNGLFGVFMT